MKQALSTVHIAGELTRKAMLNRKNTKHRLNGLDANDHSIA